MTGYRKTFYGTLEDKELELNSTTVRGLSSSTDKSSANGDSILVNIPVGVMRVVFAYPATLNDLSSVTDTNGLGAEILSSFNVINIDVNGYNGYEAKPYKVYYIDYANPNDTANSYTFTISKEG